MKDNFRKMSFTSPEQPRLTSAAALRALAHPTRLKILGRLQLHGDATATECADEVGESPSSCSYHLRTLARHGFVEETPSVDGRERRWRARIVGFEFPAGAEAPAEYQAAVELARAALLELDDEAVRAYFAHERSFSPAWREAALFSTSTIVVTPKELDELGRRIQELLEPLYATARGRAPRGARIVRIGVRAVPEP
jgi:DNA-binding transcriptional ArsR family regulator